MLTYLDGGSGIAGDMILGALVGLGLSPKELEKILQAAIKEKGWRLDIVRTERQFWPAWSVRVQGDRPYGSLDKMLQCVKKSHLLSDVKERASLTLRNLKWAEQAAHGRITTEIDPIGLGLLDTLVDVLGTAWGFWKLKINGIISSPINTGRIAPATAALIQKKKIPVYTHQSKDELATPTGVAILSTWATAFRPLPEFQLDKAGYGAGSIDIPGRPNVLALYSGTPTLPHQNYPQDNVLLLETVMDDMDPRLYPHVTELLFQQGALDVWWAPIGMKKGRPGIAFSVLCHPPSEAKLLKVLFQETTTLGVRRQPLQRWLLRREARGVRKIAYLPEGRMKWQTEYEVARKSALKQSLPLSKLLK